MSNNNSTENSLNALFHLLGKLTQLHDLADKKAYVALTIFGAMGLGAPLYMEKVIKNIDKLHFFWQNTAVILILTFLGLVICGLYHTLQTLIPRITSSQDNIVFWGHATSKKLDTLKDEWKNQTDEELQERLVIEYHSNSLIAGTKFKHSKFALRYATFAIVLFSIITAFSFNFESNKQTLNNSNPIPTIQIEGNQTK